MDIGLLLLRLAAGLTIAAHGTQKLFGWFGGDGLERTGQFFEMSGFRPGRPYVIVAGLAEMGAGVLLASGFITPLPSAIIFAVMIVAAFSVHMKKGFFITNGGFEYPFVLSVVALTLAFTGSGSLSLDAFFGYSWRGAVWGVAAILVGIVVSIIPLAQRRATPADMK